MLEAMLINAGSEYPTSVELVSTSDFITIPALCSALGLTQGTVVDANQIWFKFSFLGKTYYLPRYPIYCNTSYKILNDANLIRGKGIPIKGKNYLVRAPHGYGKRKDSFVFPSIAGNSSVNLIPGDVIGSEIFNLQGSLMETSPSGYNGPKLLSLPSTYFTPGQIVAPYSPDWHIICETAGTSESGNYCCLLNYNPVFGFTRPKTGTDSKDGSRAFRPVLISID